MLQPTRVLTGDPIKITTTEDGWRPEKFECKRVASALVLGGDNVHNAMEEIHLNGSTNVLGNLSLPSSCKYTTGIWAKTYILACCVTDLGIHTYWFNEKSF